MRAMIGCLILGIAVCSVLPGCSRGPKYYPISGAVTVDGKPMEGIQVNFLPADTAKPTASGVTNAKGRFTVDSGSSAKRGVQAGPYKVSFAASAAAEMATEYSGPRSRRLPDPTESGSLALAPDVPTPPFALEYSFADTTPFRFRVTKAEEVNFDLLPLGSLDVPPPSMANEDAEAREAQPSEN